MNDGVMLKHFTYVKYANSYINQQREHDLN